jgi:hypothetical protein
MPPPCACGLPHPAINGGHFNGLQRIEDAEPGEPTTLALYTCTCGSTRAIAAADDSNPDDFR